jgi:hypothetical protein
MKRLNFFELDLPRCANVYGTSPCTASVATGGKKCFNTRATCQDLANYRRGIPELDAAATEDQQDVASTSHSVTMPATIEVGDLLLVIMGADGNPTITTPANWTQVGSLSVTGATSKAIVLAKVALGTEDGTAVDFVKSASEESLIYLFHVKANNWHGILEDGLHVQFQQTASSTSHDPDAITPSWGEATNLWITALVGSANILITEYPTGFTDTNQEIGGTVVPVGIGSLIAKAATVDPHPFTVASAQAAVTVGIAVRPKPETTLRFSKDPGTIPIGLIDPMIPTCREPTGESSGPATPFCKALHVV